MQRREMQIAVFDSGLGGLSVLRALVRRMPQEHFLYFGDSANAPYGGRSTQEVRTLTLSAIDALMPRGLKAIVIACNTATSAAVELLRRRYPDTIIIGIEPALKLAAGHLPGGRIIVMATEVTLREEKFSRLMCSYQATHDIVRLPCPSLVEYVEQGLLDGPIPEGYLRKTLLPCLSPDTGAIVLGCTHFPFLRPLIAKLAGPDIAIYDGSEGTAAQTERRLRAAGLLRESGLGCCTLENSLHTPESIARSEQLLHLPESAL